LHFLLSFLGVLGALAVNLFVPLGVVAVKDSTPSATANVVARNIALVAATPRLSALVDPEAASLTRLLLEAYSPRNKSFLRKARSRWFQRLFHFYERLTIPGLALHQALRKRHIERAVRGSLAEGFEQVVVLGGGLDTLALRLHKESPLANFLELDHPATQRVKRDVIEGRRLAGANFNLVPVDFARQKLEDALATCPDHRAGARTVFVCEGVLMYLTADEVAHLFDVIGRQPAPAVRFVFTVMELDRPGQPAFHKATWLVRLWLNLRKEPFRSGLPRSEVASFVAARGFSLKELVTAETFRQLYLQDGRLDEVLAEGEMLGVCDRT
jgi:methyltransferase (TIGR00027 family)